MDDVLKIQEFFLQTAASHIEKMGSLLEHLMQQNTASVIEELHLHAHSLKGEALTMQYIKFGTYVTVVEKYFRNIKESNAAISPKNIDLLSSAVKKMGIVLDAIRERQKEPADLSDSTEILREQLGIAL